MTEDPFDSEEFFHLMQNYRWSRDTNKQGDVVAAFEAVKEYCRIFTNIQEPGDDLKRPFRRLETSQHRQGALRDGALWPDYCRLGRG